MTTKSKQQQSHYIQVSMVPEPGSDLDAFERMGWLRLDPARPQVSRTMVKTKFSERVTICDSVDEHPRIVSGRIRRPFQSNLDGSVFPVDLGPKRFPEREYLSLVVLQLCLGLHQIVKTEIKTEDTKGLFYRLRVVGVFRNQENIDNYIKAVAEPLLTGYRISSSVPDFWWDIENHVILTFDQKFASAWTALLVSMLKTVNSV